MSSTEEKVVVVGDEAEMMPAENSNLKRNPILREESTITDENDNKTTNKLVRSSPENVIDKKTGSGSPQKLEVPSKELRLIQKQVLIEKLMAPSKQTSRTETEEEPMETESQSKSVSEANINEEYKKPKEPLKPSKRPQQKHNQPRKTFKLQSSVLGRVKSFLPEFKSANEQLLRLPDPSKLSLESDPDRDETDAGLGPGPSCSSSKAGSSGSAKTYVEMNLALVEQSDSDTDSEDEGFVTQRQIKGLPEIPGKGISAVSTSLSQEYLKVKVENADISIANSSNCEVNKPKEEDCEQKPLITELN